MSEPRRWLDGGAPHGAGELLSAGMAELPSERSLQRTLAAVSATAITTTTIGGALGAAAKVASSSSMGGALGATAKVASSAAVGGALGATAKVVGSSALVFAAKCLAIGVTSASVMLGAAAGVRHFSQKSPAHSATPASTHRVVRASKQSQTPPQGRFPTPASTQTLGSLAAQASAQPSALPWIRSPGPGDTESLVRVTLESPPNRAASRRLSTEGLHGPGDSPPPAPVQAASNESSGREMANSQERPTPPSDPPQSAGSDLVLTEEVALIDAARQKLRSGDASGALKHLHEYDRHRDFGHLAAEALYLRMEAQLQLGNRLGAASAARELSVRFPHAPQVSRAAEILDALGEGTNY